MKNYLNKLHNLIKKSGFILFLIRFPFRVLNYMLIRLNTYFWRLFLKETGNNLLIELGVKIENPKQIIIQDNVYIGKNTVIGAENNIGVLTLNNNVHIGRSCEIDHTGNVTIGKNTLLSAKTTILSHSHGYNPRNIAVPQDLSIGENCWFGLNTIISENVKFIKPFTILATGSILTKSVQLNNCIYAGIPARKIKKYI